MTTARYQTTGRGKIASGILVPNLDEAIAFIESLQVWSTQEQYAKHRALVILQQLRALAMYEDER